jgi:hypothetical protein
MKTMPKTHQIAVTIEANAIRVVPETLVMTSDDDVQWAGSNSKRFTIEFDGTGHSRIGA